jgi:hypothetical protein
VPDDDGELEWPGQRTGLTAGQALRTQELLDELEARKAINNQHLEEKRQIGQEIAELEEWIRGFPQGKG